MTDIDALRSLRADLRKRGFFRRPTARLVGELVVHVAVMTAGVALLFSAQSWWTGGLGLLIATAGAMGVGTNTHTSSHSATSNRIWINCALTYFGYPVILGLSATYWWDKHVLRHHSGPNMKGVDGDFDLMPWFAGTLHDVEESRGWRRIYYEHAQSMVFPFAVAFTLFAQQLSGGLYLWRSLRDRKLRRTEHWIDASALVTHVAIWLVVPSLFLRPSWVVAIYVVRNLLNSYAMLIVFAPAHMPAEALRITNDPDRLAHPLAHTSTTLNFRTGRLGRWLCGGLQYQIEHHLVPDISHVHYPEISELVKEFCERQGLPYRCHDWSEGLWLAWMSIKTPNRLERLKL